MKELCFNEAALQLLRALFQLFNTGDIPTTYMDEASLLPNGTLKTGCQQSINWHMLFDRYYEDIFNSNEYAIFKRSIPSEMTDNFGQTFAQVDDFSLIRNWIHWLCASLHDAPINTLHLNEDKAEEACVELETFLLAEEVKYLEGCVLTNLTCEINEIPLSRSLTIRKASPRQLKLLYKTRGFAPPLEPFFHALYIIETNSTQKKQERHGLRNRSIFLDVHLALLLFKAGYVAAGPMYWMPESFPSSSGMGFTWGAAASITGEGYLLTSTEVPTFQATYENLALVINEYHYLRRACERFRLSYYDHIPEESLIDYMITLECLYLLEYERQELSFKLSLRIAKVLSMEYGLNKDEVYDDMYAATKIRGSLVHGDEAKVSGIVKQYGSVHKFVRIIEDYTRKSLLFFVRHPDRHTKEYFRTQVL